MVLPSSLASCSAVKLQNYTSFNFMKQILQNLQTGETVAAQVPVPAVPPGYVLICSIFSLISPGTEKMLVDFGKANLLNKARQQPDKVKEVIQKLSTDGLITTLEAVKNKLDQPLTMGYCNVGIVVEVGAEVNEFCVGDRVASNGNHAEFVLVPKNLCAKVPEQVSNEQAVFTVISAIALQGIRLANPGFGEHVVVTGLGLVGLLTVQFLKANGCNVLGMDFDQHKLDLAQRFGAQTVNLSTGEDWLSTCLDFSNGHGVDAVLITASTKSNEPVHNAATMCRKRGRIVLVGVTGLELQRADFYEKELSFQVSCSYGPGRYDPEYEEAGHDYPIAHVRWTEKRNFEAVLNSFAQGSIDTKSLISHQFPIEKAEYAYNLLLEKKANASAMAVLLEYPENSKFTQNHRIEAAALAKRRVVRIGRENPGDQGSSEKAGFFDSKVKAAFIGAGNHATRVLIPAFKTAKAEIKILTCNKGVSGVHAAKKYALPLVATDYNNIEQEKSINTHIICSSHDSHADYACKAIKQGKHVFIEKPLALNHTELDAISTCLEQYSVEKRPILMVGFNRRFSSLVQKARSLIATQKDIKCFNITVNAGKVTKEHWIQDRKKGGGRLIGEACHFVDLLRYLSNSAIKSASVISVVGSGDGIDSDKFIINLGFCNGDIGSIQYFANGHKAFAKERIEIFVNEKILLIDNFKSLKGYGWKNFKYKPLLKQDKGHGECVKQFVNAIENGLPSPISAQEIFEVSKCCIDLSAQLENQH